MVLIAATPDSVFAYCLGCKIFNLLMQIGVIPASVCERCNDLRATPGKQTRVTLRLHVLISAASIGRR